MSRSLYFFFSKSVLTDLLKRNDLTLKEKYFGDLFCMLFFLQAPVAMH